MSCERLEFIRSRAVSCGTERMPADGWSKLTLLGFDIALPQHVTTAAGIGDVVRAPADPANPFEPAWMYVSLPLEACAAIADKPPSVEICPPVPGCATVAVGDAAAAASPSESHRRLRADVLL